MRRNKNSTRQQVAELQSSVIALTQQISQLAEQLATVDDRIATRAAEYTERRISEAQQAIIDFVVTRGNEIQDGMNSLLEARSGEIYEDLSRQTETRIISTESALKDDFVQQMSELRRAVLALSRTSDAKTRVVSFDIEGETPVEPTDAAVNDVLYSMIEDRFRGDVAVIRERQSQYLPLVRDRVSTLKPLLDIGCGRGEWLALLADSGLAARGVDTNVAFVEECRSNGLTVDLGSAPDYLTQCGDDSLGAITLFQVVEHLNFSTLTDLLGEAKRVLAPGGVLILEFPNIRSLMVGATTFWIDPTHHRPLHPQVVEFLVQQAGFVLQPTIYSSPVMPKPHLGGLPEEAQAFMYELANIIGGAGDVAVVATA